MTRPRVDSRFLRSAGLMIRTERKTFASRNTFLIPDVSVQAVGMTKPT